MVEVDVLVVELWYFLQIFSLLLLSITILLLSSFTLLSSTTAFLLFTYPFLHSCFLLLCNVLLIFALYIELLLYSRLSHQTQKF